MEYLLTEATANAPTPPGDYRPDVGMENLRTEFHIQHSDIRPLILDQLNMLAEDAKRFLANTTDRYIRTHLEYVIKRIEELK